MTRQQRDEAFARLRGIYADADRAVAAAAPRCDASGRCCRFAEYGHVLFLSQLEAELLLAEAPPWSGPVTPDGCPWQIDGLCTAREPRPLGCRVYFCDPAYQDTCPEIMEEGLRQIKHLADELDLGWRYAPLHVFLGDALAQEKAQRADASRSPSSSIPHSPFPTPHSPTRRSLPVLPPDC